MDTDIYGKLERIFSNSKNKRNPALIKHTSLLSKLLYRSCYNITFHSFPTDDNYSGLSFGELPDNRKYKLFFLDATEDNGLEEISVETVVELSNGNDVITRDEMDFIIQHPKKFLEPLKKFYFKKELYD